MSTAWMMLRRQEFGIGRTFCGFRTTLIVACRTCYEGQRESDYSSKIGRSIEDCLNLKQLLEKR